MRTLISLLTLTMLLLPTDLYAAPVSKEFVATQGVLNRLVKALKAYEADFGRYPPNDKVGGGKTLLEHLGERDGKKAYYKFSAAERKAGAPLDGWGQPIRYRELRASLRAEARAAGRQGQKPRSTTSSTARST